MAWISDTHGFPYRKEIMCLVQLHEYLPSLLPASFMDRLIFYYYIFLVKKKSDIESILCASTNNYAEISRCNWIIQDLLYYSSSNMAGTFTSWETT